MCNELKNGNRVYKIPEQGVGYKVFIKRGNALYSAVLNTEMSKNKWLKWNPKRMAWGDGFCFLPNITAVKGFTVKKERNEVLYTIEYKKGLGKRDEGAHMSALCKEFKILEEVKP